MVRNITPPTRVDLTRFWLKKFVDLEHFVEASFIDFMSWTEKHFQCFEKSHCLFNSITLMLSDTRKHIWTHITRAKIDNYWKVDGERPLSGFWIRFTSFTKLGKPPLDGRIWARERFTTIQTSSRPDEIWPEVWSNVSKQSQSEEGGQWDTDKPKLDAARRLRGIYYIDSDNKEFDNIPQKRDKKMRNAHGERQNPTQFMLTKLMLANPEDAASVTTATTGTRSHCRPRGQNVMSLPEAKVVGNG